MPLGIRDWFLVIGGLMILGVLAHGVWLYIKSRRANVAIKYEKNIPNIDIDDIDLLRAELPSGGARVIGDGPVKAEPLSAAAGEVDDQTAAPPAPAVPPAPAAAPRNSSPTARSGDARSGVNLDESVPVLMDPIDQDLAAEAAGDARRPAAPGRAADTAAASDSASRPADKHADNESLQAPLFANEPIVPREQSAAGKRRKGASPRPGAPEKGTGRSEPPRKAKPAARAPEPEPQPEPEIQEVLVVNVLARGEPFTGADVLETITRRGMRYGDMNIFHRFAGAGRRRADFSMASAVEPGTFDLGAIDGYTTPGVTFFMRLPGPDAPLDAFEDMVSIARDLAAELGGDLKDEQHSVMTAQTIEHCRQRIRDFSRRQMSRRA